MLLIAQAERDTRLRGKKPSEACLAWTRDGRAITIRDTKEFTNELVPLATITQAKFSSLVRRFYRWGFRQMSSRNTDQRHRDRASAKKKVFSHPLFQRDNKLLVNGMKCTTAESTRRATAAHQLIEQQETRLLDHKFNEHLSVSATSAHLAAAPRSLSQQFGSTSLLFSAGEVGMLPSSLGFEAHILPTNYHLLQDDMRRAMMLNDIRRRMMIPEADASSRQLSYQTLAGHLLSSSGRQQHFLSSGTRSANTTALGSPDRIGPSLNQRNQAAVAEIFGGSTMSLISLLLRCNNIGNNNGSNGSKERKDSVAFS